MIAAILRWFRAHVGVNISIGRFSAVLVGALWAVVIAEQHAGRSEVIAAAVKQNTNLAVAYEEHIVRTLKGLDGALLLVRHEYRRLGSRLDINRYIDEGVIDGGLFSILSVIDEHGNVVLSSRPGVTVNYADREFFRVHQLRRQQDTFFIDAPVLGKVSNTWQIPMSRRIIKPDGSFGGVIVLSVDPGYFTRFYRKADIGRMGAVLLVGTDGIARARRIGDRISFGDDLSGTNLLREQAKNAAGHFLSRSGVDGNPRLLSYRTLPEYPLVVAVGTAESEVLADFARKRYRDYALALLVSAVIAGLATLLTVTLKRQKRDAKALATSEARFRAAFEQAAIGIVHTSLDRRYVEVNQRFCEMLGYTRDELVGRNANSITYQEDRERDNGYRHRLLSGEAASLSAEKRYVRKDGSLIWVNRTVSLVRDAEGQPLYYLRVVEDITERKRLEAELRELAATDMLTGLPNRRAFIARLEAEHARLRRFERQRAAVLMLDADYFKRINDTHGHPVGDAVLRGIAAVISGEIREVDLCARIGGEEFAVMVAGATPQTAREFAERLRRRIAEAGFMHGNIRLDVTASIGVAELRAADDSADAALVRADRALYRAKDLGRDRVESFVSDEPAATAENPL